MNKIKIALSIFLILITNLACGQSAIPTAQSSALKKESIFDSGKTTYGFFATPPEVSLISVFENYKALGQHADVTLIQENIPWLDFLNGVDVESKKIVDMQNARKLGSAQNLESIYIVDPLNGLNRKEFQGVPAEWGDPNFGMTEIRKAYMNFVLRVIREFHPRYLGLASEINSYADAHPEDFENFLSLYREAYAAIKNESPQTQVFVTFQWEQLNNVAGALVTGTPLQTRWEQIEVFEPNLDLWVISSYPFIGFESASDIPADYYARLLKRTNKPLAVAEGGFVSRQTGNIPGTPQDQVDYLNAIHDQIGMRLDFWIYLLLHDLNYESYTEYFSRNGIGETDINTLGFFVTVGLLETDGTPKAAMQVWDSFRTNVP